MSVINETAKAGGARPPAMVKVWDPFIRVFHWSLATLFLVAYLTGDQVEKVHIAAGYAIAGLIALRMVWGVVGPHHARFASFVRPPREVFAYLRDIGLLSAPRYLGHNPAGGAMIVALLVTLIGTCITGYMMTTDAFWGSQWVEDTHKYLANFTLGLVAVHVIGVLLASFEHRENLLKSMLTGKKRRL
jgi:cytochrome b